MLQHESCHGGGAAVQQADASWSWISSVAGGFFHATCVVLRPLGPCRPGSCSAGAAATSRSLEYAMQHSPAAEAVMGVASRRGSGASVQPGNAATSGSSEYAMQISSAMD
ncbi:hypothetical protein ZWY2020_032051 [Hordeum vulgare]|nr:hypothetical protein ZWY2020_032051 [Hordeum vulgare]